MLHGIDISNWQKGLQLPEDLDFCICKATEGFRFVDPCCDGFVQQCVRKGILFGFYHFARNNIPEDEAVHFRNNTKGYELIGVPVLDIEDSAIQDWGSWAQRFVDKYHAITGVYPMIYTSASMLPRFVGYQLTKTCGLWIAGYPDAKERTLHDVPVFPYSCAPWPFVAIWQYTSNGWIGTFDEPVDMDIAYMDASAWKRYANPIGTSDATMALPSPEPSPEQAKSFHFENDIVSLDIRLKRGGQNGS